MTSRVDHEGFDPCMGGPGVPADVDGMIEAENARHEAMRDANGMIPDCLRPHGGKCDETCEAAIQRCEHGTNIDRYGCTACLSAFTDVVNSPAHYTMGGIEVIDAIEAWELGFRLGNVVKYSARCGKKDPAKALEDLRKAEWYLQREIAARS